MKYFFGLFGLIIFVGIIAIFAYGFSERGSSLRSSPQDQEALNDFILHSSETYLGDKALSLGENSINSVKASVLPIYELPYTVHGLERDSDGLMVLRDNWSIETSWNAYSFVQTAVDTGGGWFEVYRGGSLVKKLLLGNNPRNPENLLWFTVNNKNHFIIYYQECGNQYCDVGSKMFTIDEGGSVSEQYTIWQNNISMHLANERNSKISGVVAIQDEILLVPRGSFPIIQIDSSGGIERQISNQDALEDFLQVAASGE